MSKPGGLLYQEKAKREQIAVTAINHGARKTLVQDLSGLDARDVGTLYRVVKGQVPRGGQWPINPDWYAGGRKPLHMTAFANIYNSLDKYSTPGERFVAAYDMYHDYCRAAGIKPLLDIHRAWTGHRLSMQNKLQEYICECGTRQLLPVPAPLDYKCHRCRRNDESEDE